MKAMAITRRGIFVAGASALLGACAIIPKGPTTNAPPPGPQTGAPGPTQLPQDETRHRVALLVPTSGSNAAVGQSIANATTMALLDTNASNLRITTYNTAAGAGEAARRAIADGNGIILGPLMGDNVDAVRAIARPARVPIISFSNDAKVAGNDVFVMGHIPEQSVERSVQYARSHGGRDFAVLAPGGEYGERAEAALMSAVRNYGGSVADVERYTRSNTSVISAAQRLKAKGGFDSVLLADGTRISILAANELKPKGAGPVQLIGTDLWSGEAAVTRAPSLNGAIFSAVSDGRYKRFTESYSARFGSNPYRIATLGYDAVLLTLRIARDWKPGRPFPATRLVDPGGFIGLDGAFRFRPSGLVQRALEVRQVRNGAVVVVDPAPSKFD